MKRHARFRVLVVAETIVLALGIAFLVFGRAGFVGSPVSYVVVSGHSMEPTFHTGDVVVLTHAGRYRKGEVIGYEVPAGGPGAGLIIIHRIIGGSARTGFVMRGDNKPYPDPWRPRPVDIVGHERVMIPKAGLAIGYIRSPAGLAVIAGLLTVAIALGGSAGADPRPPTHVRRKPEYRWRGRTAPAALPPRVSRPAAATVSERGDRAMRRR